MNIYPVDGFVTKLGPLGTNLIYSTYLGGGWVDVGWGIAVDPAGNAYVAGYTESTNFPTANVSGGFTNYGGKGDAFVTKFGPAGTNLIYSMYLGGTKLDSGNDVAADAAGLAYVTGFTTSRKFSLDHQRGATLAGRRRGCVRDGRWRQRHAIWFLPPISVARTTMSVMASRWTRRPTFM